MAHVNKTVKFSMIYLSNSKKAEEIKRTHSHGHRRIKDICKDDCDIKQYLGR